MINLKTNNSFRIQHFIVGATAKIVNNIQNNILHEMDQWTS